MKTGEIKNLLKYYNPLNNDSAVPHQEQLAERMKSLLRDQRVDVGMAMPSLRVLAEHFEVKHAIVQQAFNSLAAEGYIEKKHGKGSFVKQKPDFGSRKLCRHLCIPMMQKPYEEDYIRPLANMFSGVSMGLGMNGWTFQGIPCQPDGSEFATITELYCNGQTDGVILIGSVPGIDEHCHEAEQLGMPIVLVNQYAEKIPSFTLSVDEACHCVGKRLMEEKKGSFMVIRGESENPRFYEIEESLAAIVQGAGGEFSQKSVSIFSAQKEHLSSITDKIVEKLAQTEELPDAIFCSPELMTLAVSNALQRLELDAIEIVSIDDCPDIDHYSPNKIAQIKVPYLQLGLKAASTLVNALDRQRYPDNCHTRIACKEINGELL